MGNSSKRYSIVVSEQALEMLVSHTRFLANVSIEAAEKLIKAFEYAADLLQIMPERNPWLHDENLPIHKYRKLVLDKHYLLIYQIKNERVFIDYVVDCRQNYRWLL
ncbi:type II toxin-antitoxin system RelE/ParE family toxin [Sporolactobacillus sp. STCC-11]|uniref:type II toxin-antitoxin system RelE/ParE family toxin n=1 Tax=Sporolactobacillus caesalpiniae TaxID=3230362 RepID=UPI0033963160